MSKRETSVAGTFYPDSCGQIKEYIEVFEKNLSKPGGTKKAKAIISPHAGYIYSGFTANMAYREIETKDIKRVVVIGPSHRVYIKGASVALYDEYSSPCATVKMDLSYSKRLVEEYSVLHFDPSAHAEHSTETQVPFIKHYFSEIELVEIVYGEIDYRDLVPIIEQVLDEKESFVVISTDLSHFYDLKTANVLDSVCLKAIQEMDVAMLEEGCEACGMLGVKALLTAARKSGLKSELMDYRTSCDQNSDETSVVGYLSALIL